MRETPKAAAAFDEYCLLGPARSLSKLAENFTKTSPKPHQKSENLVRQLKEWSTEHNWQERVKLYDKERAEEKRRKQEAEIDKMNEEHALMGRTQALRMVEHIQALIEAKSFGSQASVQLFKYATDLERLARGGVTERSEVTGSDGEHVQAIFYMPKVEREEKPE